jgi:hypothetical protein
VETSGKGDTALQGWKAQGDVAKIEVGTDNKLGRVEVLLPLLYDHDCATQVLTRRSNRRRDVWVLNFYIDTRLFISDELLTAISALQILPDKPILADRLRPPR